MYRRDGYASSLALPATIRDSPLVGVADEGWVTREGLDRRARRAGAGAAAWCSRVRSAGRVDARHLHRRRTGVQSAASHFPRSRTCTSTMRSQRHLGVKPEPNDGDMAIAKKMLL
jgi:hypothetical protein